MRLITPEMAKLQFPNIRSQPPESKPKPKPKEEGPPEEPEDPLDGPQVPDKPTNPGDPGGGSGDPQKIWSARKKYHQTEFEPDSSSIGYEIEVYQDTINKATREYLVNFDYLTQLLENYGFDLVTPEEAETTLANPMPDGTATFDGMYHQMEIECKKKRDDGGGGGEWDRRCQQEYGSALYMSAEEKQISFYNRYFIFRKNRNINAKQLKNSFLSYAGLQEEQQLASGATETETDVALETVALEKIAKASRPIDVASKPAIAARILQEHREKEVIAGTTATLKIKPKPKKLTVKAAAAAAASSGTGASAAEEPAAAPAAPIEQIEKKIQKRTKKVALSAADSSAGAVSGGPSSPAPAKPKRQTKKKTDL